MGKSRAQKQREQLAKATATATPPLKAPPMLPPTRPSTTPPPAAAAAVTTGAEVPPWLAWARRYWRFIQRRDPELVNAIVDNHEKLAAWLTDRGRYAANKMHSLTTRGASTSDAERVVLDEIIEPVTKGGDPEPLSPAIAQTLPERITRFESSVEGKIFAD